ncbi:hypothetical protein HFZ78_18495 [Priestia megaterium]|uniref:Uncharacterized protein n=1 Tax=Priestia megaterium TaxID=1404 RepID=A0A6H1P4I0_PRIMG|nr:hypothetical protein [Priestia megaterium]QIZ08453.1 hypothetical protein HFZ78_18495 [Priestia megaterium]
MDIKKTLLDAGVSEEHLSFLLEDKLKNDKSFKCFFECIDQQRENQLVPVKKIKGLSRLRGEAGFSWWDHALRKAGNIAGNRLEENDKRLQSTTLDEFRISFGSNNFPAVELNYYNKFDEYYVSSDGNHRTLWAKLVDADNIKARVYNYKYNPIKHESYKRIQGILSDYTKLVHVANFEMKEGIKEGELEYNGWPVYSLKFPNIYDYLNEEQISNFKNYVYKNIKMIENIMDRYFKFSKIPDKWRMKLFKLLINHLNNENEYIYENLVTLQEQGWVPNISVKDWKKLKSELLKFNF